MGCKLRGVLLCPKHQRSLRTGGRRVALHLSVSSTRMTQAQVRAPRCWMLLTRQPPCQEIRGCCVELADGGISLRSSYSIYRARQKKKTKSYFLKERVTGRHHDRSAFDSKMSALYLWTDFFLQRQMHALGYRAVGCSHACLSRRRWAQRAADQKLYRAVRLNCFFFHHPFKKKN